MKKAIKKSLYKETKAWFSGFAKLKFNLTLYL